MPRFTVTDTYADIDRSKPDALYLVATDWDDWFKFSTLYNLYYVDSSGKLREIGGTKVGQFNLKPASRGGDVRDGYRIPAIPSKFDSLSNQFFSLGQDASFYENLSDISSDFRETVLKALNDIAYDPEMRSRAEDEPVTAVSLLREVPLTTVHGQFARLSRGGARLTPFNFGFVLTRSGKSEISFAVAPDSTPPSNIHVLIGRNGVGKSTLLNDLANAMVIGSRQVNEDGSTESGPWDQLSNVVSVSFSAFDAFEPLSALQDRTKGLTYHYVGLKKVGAKREDSSTKDPAALSREMTLSAKTCFVGARRARLRRALSLLEGDPVFAETGLAELIGNGDEAEVFELLPNIFRRLSSGHKIVLLTVTKLVETVEEKSLVMLDEPEAHLHPPLLSAFVRALSDLLTNRNGIAIVATHSPVVLQEVPRLCVWKLQRLGANLDVSRPELETFGENVGTLTDEVFGLEVTGTGFHKMLADAANQHGTYEAALASFGDQLGSEGRAILRALVNASTPRYVAG